MSLKTLLNNPYFEIDNILYAKLADTSFDDNFFTLSVVNVDDGRRVLASVQDLLQYVKEMAKSPSGSHKILLKDFGQKILSDGHWDDVNEWATDRETLFHTIFLYSDVLTFDVVNNKIKNIKIVRNEKELERMFCTNYFEKEVFSSIKRKIYGNNFLIKRVNEFAKQYKSDKNLGKLMDEVRNAIPINKD